MKTQQCNVIMLTTEKASPLWKTRRGNFFTAGSQPVNPKLGQNIHLYITIPNGEIKDGDWYYNIVSGKTVRCEDMEDFTDSSRNSNNHKIIATTDDQLVGVPILHRVFLGNFVTSNGFDTVDLGERGFELKLYVPLIPPTDSEFAI